MLTKDLFNSKDIASVDKVIKVLKYLNQGRDLKIENTTFRLGETETDGFKLMVKFTETEYIGYTGDFDDFSSLCNTLTEEQLFIMAGEIALTKINKR